MHKDNEIRITAMPLGIPYVNRTTIHLSMDFR